MKTWRGYSIFDLCMVLLGIICTTIAGIIFHSSWYLILHSILIILCVFTQAKGKILTMFLGVLGFGLYIIIAYMQGYYGESIFYLVIMFPMLFYGIIHWLSNKDKKNAVVLVRGNLSKKEYLYASIGFIFVSIGVYFLLKVLNTSELILSTLSFVSLIPAIYLLIRRCKWNQVAFLINDFIVPILWIIVVIKGDWSYLTICVTYVFQLIFDVYGLIEWIKLEKVQKNSDETTV